MAKAFIRTVEVMVPTMKRDGITLTLSDREARTLKLILGRVGGDPDTSARRYADSIYRTLQEVIPYDYGQHSEKHVERGAERIYLSDSSLAYINGFAD